MRWVVKIVALLGVVLAVSFLTSLMTTLLRGDPAEVVAGQRASDKAYVKRLREDLGLNEPVLVRYGKWIGGVARGDFGKSMELNPEPVGSKLRRTIPNTVQLAVLAELVAIVFAVPLGVWSAYRADSRGDKVATGVTFGLLALPVFVSAMVLIYVFGVQLGWLKIQFVEPGRGGWIKSLSTSIMPVIVLSLGILAVYARLLRTDMIATLQEDFILNARARGLTNRYILFRHALRPSAFSLLTVAGINVGTLIGGSVVVEQIFSVNGVGNLLVQSVSSRDIFTVQAIVLLISMTYVGVNFLVDVLYSALDPRIRRA
ncbi:MAG: ABC transporter permease [Actinobacteria bacterium]|nr:ABC transporter permease [Actinomycetota bacterium]